MRNTVLRYGLASGALSSGLMLAATWFLEARKTGTADFVGYSSMVLVALVIFFGIRSYRENVGEGRLTFRRGFVVGLGITLISSACYLATFQLLYYELEPGIGETYAACMVERARDSGAGPAEIEARERQARRLLELYENPWSNVAVTLLEPLPLGLLLTLISAAILRKR